MTEYGHNWTGLLILTAFGLLMGVMGMWAARREAKAKLRERDAKDAFRKTVLLSCRKYPWLEEALANEFEVSYSTVRRWADGITAPLPRMRNVVINYIRNRTAGIP